MFQRMGKWYQYSLFSKNPQISGSVPETKLFTIENLSEFLSRYEFIYLKHDRGGQGKGIYKIYKGNDGLYYFDGFTPRGEIIKISMDSIEDFQPEKYPYRGFKGLLNSAYIVQEGIKSLTLNGDPLSIRVHVQKLNGEWLISGMYGKVATAETFVNGIVNANRGSQVMPISELLSAHLGLNVAERNKMVKLISEISIAAVEMVSLEFSRLEYGVDFGIKAARKPILFEVNSYPGVGNFAKVENKALLKKILQIRKMQKEE